MRRVLSNKHQNIPQIDDPFPIQFQFLYSRPPGGCKSGKNSLACIPLEMILPALLPGMEKLNSRVCDRINRFSVVVFSIIASLAGISKIIQAVCSPFASRNNVFNRKRIRRVIGLRKAIFTTMIGALADLFFSGPAYPFRHSGQL